MSAELAAETFQRFFKLRTITYFISATPIDLKGWRHEIIQGASFLKESKQAYERKGYTVQTLRIATRALACVETPAQARELAIALERVALEHGIAFLSLGSSTDRRFFEKGAIAGLAADLRFTSFSTAWQREWGLHEARLLAGAIFDTAQTNSANFRFCVAFNCQTGIPYFPAAAAGELRGFAIGTENSGLLAEAFRRAAGSSADGNDVLQAAQESLAAVMTAALQPVEAIAQQLEAAHGTAYLGIDSSIVPALEPPSIPQAFELLRLGSFGGGGTLAIAQRITAALKSLPLKLCGYCGLMLPVCEDAGLAGAAASGALTVPSLLLFSAVCGVGLDTVPVPGPGRETPPEDAGALVDRCAAVLLDTAAMAFRLNKPLSVRLLPVPGAAAREPTAFRSPYLLESRVMQL